MWIRAADLDIPEDDPFRDDKLERNQWAEPLTQLVSNTTEPFVLAVDSGWGTGKTTFLRMWCRHLQNRGHRCLYFNAWKNDFALDPLAALVGELTTGLQEQGGLSQESRRWIVALKKLGNTLVNRYVLAAVTSTVYNLISTDSTAETDEAQIRAEKVADATGAVVSDAIEKYQQTRDDLESFRKHLAALVQELTLQESGSSKVVMFIDELDRCRPLYAVELLERVKHLFDVPGVTFVLGLDLEQLSHSVKAVSGGTFDGSGYLRRFFDLRWKLPYPAKMHLGALPQWTEVAKIYKNLGLGDADDLKSYLVLLFEASRMSLRSQIQALTRLSLLLRTLPKASNIAYHPATLAVLLFIHEWKRELFEKVFERDTGIDELHAEIGDLIKFRPSNSNDPTEYEHSEICWTIEAAVLSGSIQIQHNSDRLNELKVKRESTRTTEYDMNSWNYSPEKEVLDRTIKISHFRGSVRENYQQIKRSLAFADSIQFDP